MLLLLCSRVVASLTKPDTRKYPEGKLLATDFIYMYSKALQLNTSLILLLSTDVVNINCILPVSSSS